jgi:hypothetical protein
VLYLLTKSLITEKRVNHVNLPRGARRSGHNAICDAELFARPVRDYDSVVSLVDKEKDCPLSLKETMTKALEGAPNISKALITFVRTSGQFVCYFRRKEDNVIVKGETRLNECVDNRGRELFRLQQQCEILARERSSRSSERMLIVKALLN